MAQKSSDSQQVAKTKLSFKWSDREDPRWKEFIQQLGMHWDGKFVQFSSHTVQNGFDVEMVLAVGKRVFDVDFQINYSDILDFCKFVLEVYKLEHEIQA